MTQLAWSAASGYGAPRGQDLRASSRSWDIVTTIVIGLSRLYQPNQPSCLQPNCSANQNKDTDTTVQPIGTVRKSHFPCIIDFFLILLTHLFPSFFLLQLSFISRHFNISLLFSSLTNSIFLCFPSSLPRSLTISFYSNYYLCLYLLVQLL